MYHEIFPYIYLYIYMYTNLWLCYLINIYFILVFHTQILEEVPEVDEAEEGAIEDDKPAVKLAKKTDERRWSVVAQKILMEALVAGDSDETMKRLKKASDNLVGWRSMITQNLFKRLVVTQLCSVGNLQIRLVLLSFPIHW